MNNNCAIALIIYDNYVKIIANEGDKMHQRTETRVVKVGDITIGGQNKVVIQSMCNIKTSHYQEVIQQILELEEIGVEMMRVSIMDEDDAHAIQEIKKAIHIPLVADIHFDYRLALLAIDNGIDKIRINPGNIGRKEYVHEIVQACQLHHIPIRIGVNSGSLEKEFGSDSSIEADALVASAQKYVAMLEEWGFYDIVLSLKGSDVLTTIAAYRKAADIFSYPLHLGITEAGTKEIGVVRSVAGLAPLLEANLGDTMRISLSCHPREEVITMKRLLHDLHLYPHYPTLISCPTCGRTQVDLIPVANAVMEFLETIPHAITVAIMGCVVNGPGEAKYADIGVAGGKDEWLLFKKGRPIKKIKSSDLLDVLFEEIRSFFN